MFAIGSEVASGDQRNQAIAIYLILTFLCCLVIGIWWIWIEQRHWNFRAIKLTLDSNYSFSIDIQKKITVSTIGKVCTMPMKTQLATEFETPGASGYAYSSNHNMLNLNGVMFARLCQTHWREYGQAPNCPEVTCARVTFKNGFSSSNLTLYLCLEYQMKKVGTWSYSSRSVLHRRWPVSVALWERWTRHSLH